MNIKKLMGGGNLKPSKSRVCDSRRVSDNIDVDTEFEQKVRKCFSYTGIVDIEYGEDMIIVYTKNTLVDSNTLSMWQRKTGASKITITTKYNNQSGLIYFFLKQSIG